MTYYGAAELARSFRTVRANTIQIATEIPEEQYAFRPAEGCRSVAETLVHIAVMPRVQHQIHIAGHLSDLTSFDFFGMMSQLRAELAQPRTKDQILDLLRTEGELFASALEAASDDFLGESVQYPAGMQPPFKSRFEMLISAKEHEMHHRGQLMLVQRLLGIKPHLTRHMDERIAAMQAAAQAKS